jgi:hypothetical protein
MVRSSIRRASMESTAELIARNSRDRVPIGALLLADEVILPQDLDFALDHQKYTNQPLGQILVRIGALQGEELDKALKLQNKNHR